MGLWGRIERTFWTGEVVKDYGVISDVRLSHAVRRRISVILAGKAGSRVVIRVVYRRWFSATVQFVELDRDAVSKLRDTLDDALGRM